MSFAQNTCTNCATWMQDLIKYALMQKDYAANLISSNANIITATQQTLETTNNRILIPLRDALTLMTIIQSGDQIQNLILGSTGGQSLLVTDPQRYFQSKQNNTVKGVLSLIPRNSIYGNSILNSVVGKYKNNTAASKVQSLSQSSIPSIVQSKTCPDESLTRLAEEESANRSTPYDINELNQRKQELYDSLCRGDPTRDPALAQKLNNIYKQRPDIGGWDSWLALTGGDNAYTKSEQVKLVVADEAQKAEDQAKLDFQIGGGIRSATNCAEWATNNGSGDEDTTLTSEAPLVEDNNLTLPSERGDTSSGSSLPCLRETITKSAASLKTLYEESIVSPLRTLQASFGTGAGSLVSTAYTTVGILRSINNIINSGSPTSYGTVGNYGTVSNQGTVGNLGTVTSSAPVQNLRNNPQQKGIIIDPIDKNLTAHLNGLSTLETTEQNYLAEINSYGAQIQSLKSCYDRLTSDFPNLSGSGSANSFMTYYTPKKAATDTLRNSISTELSKIGTTRTFVTETLTRIRASNSSEEISSIFNNYQNRVDRENLPTITSAPVREGEYIMYRSTVQEDTGANGNIPAFRSECDRLRAQEEERIRQEGFRNNTGSNRTTD